MLKEQTGYRISPRLARWEKVNQIFSSNEQVLSFLILKAKFKE